ncbi:MAG: C40 family peptidase [Clostridiales bacterium]|nr:C40 family peptidase [Clostridiales bacterium]
MGKNHRYNSIFLLLLAAVILFCALLVGSRYTLAAKPDKLVVLEQAAEHVLDLGSAEERAVNGANVVYCEDPSILSAELADGLLRVRGLQAGSATLYVSSDVGLVLPYSYQVRDPLGISAYTLKSGGEVYLPAVGQSASLPLITEPADALTSIDWWSLSPEVALVEDGLIVAKSRGVTLILGRFIDCWGLERELPLLVSVGVPLNGDALTDFPPDAEDAPAEYTQSAPTDAVQLPDDPSLPPPISAEVYAAIFKEAKSHLGKPYVFGASGPDSFDCSGFVSYVYGKIFARFGRTTAQGLYNRCTPISKEQARPGDLIFFTGTYNAGRPVTHVGIYMGNDEMIHAGKPVNITNINKKYYADHFYAFGRLPEREAKLPKQ